MRVCLSRFRLSRAQPNVTLGHLASRIAGSSDLYEHSGRRPHASINFVSLSLSRSLSVDLVCLLGTAYGTRRLHTDGSGLLRPQAQPRQSRGQPRRPRRQSQLEPRSRGTLVDFLHRFDQFKMSFTILHSLRSWQGPTDNPEINELRWRQRANMLATMFLSLGVCFCLLRFLSLSILFFKEVDFDL
jgi:pullulanase/glycogen debranching enzyme